MIKLFEALVAKAPKKHTIDFFCNKLFAAFAPPTAVSVSSAAEPTSDAAEPTSDAAEPTSDAAEPTPDATEPIPNAADDDSDQEEDEDEDEDDELLLLESPDLPAKDIRALVSVACNLRQSSEHPDMITADHVKDKLYHDKQETIPRAAMELIARLITAVRCITPRKDQPFSFATWFSTGLIRTT